MKLSAVKFRTNGEEEETFDQLINPGEPIPSDMTNIHGITDKMVKGKPSIEEVILEFIEFIGKSGHILLAHNASFDVGFVGVDIARLKIFGKNDNRL